MYERLAREEAIKYDEYFTALRKAAKDAKNAALQTEASGKKQEWLKSVMEKKHGYASF